MKRNTMRTVPAVLTLVFLVALCFFVLHGLSGRWECFRNLKMIDHFLNCPSCVRMGKSDGFIDSEGNWKMDDSNILLHGLNTNRLSCPVSSEKYDVTYVVGTHPQCPTHGDLIRFYGCVPHHLTFRWAVWCLAPHACALGAVVCGIWALIALAIFRRRKRREDHNQQADGTPRGRPSTCVVGDKMMKLRYTVSMEDVLAFHQYFHRHSPTVRRSKRMVVLGIPSVLMTIATYHGIRDHSWSPPITMLIICAMLVPFMKWSFERNLKKTAERIYRERPTKGLLGEHVLAIDETGVTERTDVGEQLTRWEGVERIETTAEHAFIFVGAIMAHVVPRTTVTEGDFDEFIATATKKWQAANPQPSVAG